MGNSPRRRLLFTGGGGAGSEALNRLLGERFEVHFADADIEAKPHGIASANFHSVPFANDSSFIVELSRLCRKLGIDLLIPGVDEELLPVARQRDDIGCTVLLPPEEFIALHLDKFSSNRFLLEHGLPAPLTEKLPEHNQSRFPCIVKPCQGRGSRNVAIINSEQEAQAHVFASRHPAADFILQELLVGQEYTVMMAADQNGRLGAVVPVKVGIKRGITLRATTDADKEVIAACCAIHATKPVPGCYNIQLIKTENAECKPFEINPRISTTSCLALAAGASFIDIYLGEHAAEGLVPFVSGMGLRRSWFNEFI